VSQLPQGWTTTTLGAIAEYVTSGSRDWSKYYSTRGALFVRTEDINTNRLTNIADIARVQLPERVEGKRTLIKQGDLLITITGANVGKCARIANPLPEAYVSQSVALVRLLTPSIGPYVHLQLLAPGERADKTLLQQSAYGMGRPVLSLTNVRDIPLNMAPAKEQQRIVQKLDAVLDKVHACRERLDRVPRILKKFREAVLEAAVSGRLTEDCRGSRNVADWSLTPVESLCSAVFDGPFGSHLKSADYSDSGARVIRLENIGHLKFLGDRETFVPRRKYLSLEKHSLTVDDVMFSSFVDEEVRVCLVPSDLGAAINKADCFCLRIDPSKALAAFVAYRLATVTTYRDLKELVHGATRPRINLSQLRSYEIALPALKEQQEIVRRVDELLSSADALQGRFADAIANVERVTPSVLAKSFRGELVPQNPTDEPAEKMLERLRKRGVSTAAAPTRGADSLA